METLRRREGGASVEESDQDYLFEQFRVDRGCLGYIVASARRAAIFDPEVEMVEPMLDFVFEHGLKPAYIVDTHTHADHVSGARELKTKTTAKIVMHEKAPASCVDIRVEDGDRLEVGDLSIKFIHTPGHAKDLVSVLLPDRILTADALLIGSCGRTDLPNGNAVRQYHTLYYTLPLPPRRPARLPGTRLQRPRTLDPEGGEEKQPQNALRHRRRVRRVHGKGEPRHTHPRLPTGRRPQSKHGMKGRFQLLLSLKLGASWRGETMSVIDELLRNNEEYASTFDKGRSADAPGKARGRGHLHGRPFEPVRHARAQRRATPTLYATPEA